VGQVLFNCKFDMYQSKISLENQHLKQWEMKFYIKLIDMKGYFDIEKQMLFTIIFNEWIIELNVIDSHYLNA
jgi:hypothetical protein